MAATIRTQAMIFYKSSSAGSASGLLYHTICTPIMSIMRGDDKWVTFNVREELLVSLPMGKEVDVMIPALGKKVVKVKIYYIKDMGSYAVWNATKATGQYDSKTFQVKARPVEDIEELRPGMSVLLKRNK